MIGIRRDRAATVTRAARQTVPAALIVMAGLGLAACSESARLSGATAGSGGAPAAAHAKTEAVQVIGEIDADMGAVGTFTGQGGRPARAPANNHRPAGAAGARTLPAHDAMGWPL